MLELGVVRQQVLLVGLRLVRRLRRHGGGHQHRPEDCPPHQVTSATAKTRREVHLDEYGTSGPVMDCFFQSWMIVGLFPAIRSRRDVALSTARSGTTCRRLGGSLC